MQYAIRSIRLGLVGLAVAGALAAVPAVATVVHHPVVARANGYDTSPGAVQPDNGYDTSPGAVQPDNGYDTSPGAVQPGTGQVG